MASKGHPRSSVPVCLLQRHTQPASSSPGGGEVRMVRYQFRAVVVEVRIEDLTGATWLEWGYVWEKCWQDLLKDWLWALNLYVLGFSKLSSVINGCSYLQPPFSLETLFFYSKLESCMYETWFFKWSNIPPWNFLFVWSQNWRQFSRIVVKCP